MTAEVLIMRQNVIVLAGDKAVTLENGKSFNTTRKIFSLDDDFPVAMMINGYVDFEGVFIGDLIGEFKKQYDFKKIGDIEDIKNRFLEFLEKNTSYTSVGEYIDWKLADFKKELADEILAYGFDRIFDYDKNDVIDEVKSLDTFETEFDDIIPNGNDKSKCNLEIWKIFSHWLSCEGTGIIIAGYDADSYYPSFFEINVHCNDGERLFYDEIDSRVNCPDSFIKVFAIKDEAYAFLTGVSDDFEESIKYLIKKSHIELIKDMRFHLEDNGFESENIEKIIEIYASLVKKEQDNLDTSIKKYKCDSIDYASESVEYLPQDLICVLSDYLIQLTGLKQKIFENVETVSIETDVGFLTKSNNFNWFKRKDEHLNNKRLN